MRRAPIIAVKIDWRARLFLETWSIIGLWNRRKYIRSLKNILKSMIDSDVYPNYIIDIDQILQNWINFICLDSPKNLVKLKMTWRDYVTKKGFLIPSRNKIVLLETTLELYLAHVSEKIIQTGWATGHNKEKINEYIDALKDIEVLIADSMIDPLKHSIARQRKAFWDRIRITNLDINSHQLDED